MGKSFPRSGEVDTFLASLTEDEGDEIKKALEWFYLAYLFI